MVRGKPWAELSSAERLDAILLAVDELDDARWGSATASAIAMRVERDHKMELAGWGKAGSGNGLRRMSKATRVTPGITMLRKRGLLALGGRSDGRSGTADHLTREGEARVRELRAKAAGTEVRMQGTLEERVAAVKQATGYEPEGEAVLELDGLRYGDRVRVIEDDDDAGLGSGEEGYLVLERVGSAAFRNERVAPGILLDGQDSPLEPDTDNLEPAD